LGSQRCPKYTGNLTRNAKINAQNIIKLFKLLILSKTKSNEHKLLFIHKMAKSKGREAVRV